VEEDFSSSIYRTRLMALYGALSDGSS
jgi:hypothetical protein